MNGQLASEALMAATEYIKGDENGLPTDEELIFLQKVKEQLLEEATKPQPPKIKPSPFRKSLGRTYQKHIKVGDLVSYVYSSQFNHPERRVRGRVLSIEGDTATIQWEDGYIDEGSITHLQRHQGK